MAVVAPGIGDFHINMEYEMEGNMMEEIMKELMQDKRVRKALAYLQEDQEQMMEDLLELVQIPAFSNHERKKAEAMRDKFTALGLQDVHMDGWTMYLVDCQVRVRARKS